MNLSPITETLLKRTTSRCPVCHADRPAEVWKVGGRERQRVLLRRRCAEHGEAEACISSDARFYWLAQGDPANGCCGGQACAADERGASGTLGRNVGGASSPVAGIESIGAGAARGGSGAGSPAYFERLSTCLALIEIVHSCNLACPTCYADSPQSAHIDAVPLDDLQRRIRGVIARKGGIEILQLSGGEPTLHPQFHELLAWCHVQPEIDYVLLNTNGVRLATDDAFLDALGRTFRSGKFQLYLQFDGPQAAGQRALRGADLRAIRQRCIERCGALGIPITLAMTVTPENLAQVWASVEFGLQFPHVRGVAFQPIFGSGRVSRGGEMRDAGCKVQDGAAPRDQRLQSEHPASAAQKLAAQTPDSPATVRYPASCISQPASPTLNTADIILALVEQAAGRLRFDDFTPLPCGDPNCATIGYLLRTPLGLRSISEFIDFAAVQGFLRDKVRYSPDDLARCGCESEPLGALLHLLESGTRSSRGGPAEADASSNNAGGATLPASVPFRLFLKPFMDAWTWDQDRIDRCCTHVIRPDGQLDSFCRYYATSVAKPPRAGQAAGSPER